MLLNDGREEEEEFRSCTVATPGTVDRELPSGSLYHLLFDHSFFQFLQHIAYPETVFVTAGSLASTLGFYYYIEPPPQGFALAGKLNFTLIGTAVLFPALFMASSSGMRRFTVLTIFSKLKAQLCQFQLGLLNWRTQITATTTTTFLEQGDMGIAWDQKVVDTCVEYVLVLNAVLNLPPLLIRHSFSMRGLEFAKRITLARYKRVLRLTELSVELNCLVEDVKARGLSPQESIRLFQYTSLLAKYTEELLLIKQYRSGEASRAFTRVVLFVCILFYGPYYSFVAGNLKPSHGSGGAMNLAFSCCLTVVCTLTLISIVAIQRGTEDPFTRGTSALKLSHESQHLAQRLREIHAHQRIHRRWHHHPSHAAGDND